MNVLLLHLHTPSNVMAIGKTVLSNDETDAAATTNHTPNINYDSLFSITIIKCNLLYFFLNAAQRNNYAQNLGTAAETNITVRKTIRTSWMWCLFPVFLPHTFFFFIGFSFSSCVLLMQFFCILMLNTSKSFRRFQFHKLMLDNLLTKPCGAVHYN